MSAFKKSVRDALPAPVLSAYHFCMAQLAALLVGYPSRQLLVIAVTGTKGKSSTTEMITAILEQSGHKVAVMNSIRFKIADDSRPNLTRMSTPGRFFIQNFLSKAVHAGCTAAVLELTSEGARQYRHRAIDLDALVFTNLAPEHIESHGSYEAYSNAKFEIGLQLARSRKRPRAIVANADDKEAARYLTLPVELKLPFSLSSTPHESTEREGWFEFDTERIKINLPGEFSLQNALAAATVCRAFDVKTSAIAQALGAMHDIPGRAQRVDAGQSFTVVVDYAHTPDSLTALYDAYSHARKICVLGSTGGGRDMWKRSVMGGIADSRCDEIILTNEDPYDEDPRSIVDGLARGMRRAPQIIMDRRAAIGEALKSATLRQAQGQNVAVLITGKGTDPNICGPRGTKIPWSDAQVAREELEKIGAKQAL